MGIVSTNALRAAMSLNNEKMKAWVKENAGSARLELCFQKFPEVMSTDTLYALIIDNGVEKFAITDGHEVYVFSRSSLPSDIVNKTMLKDAINDIPVATSSNDGLMTAIDKSKLDSLENYTPARHKSYPLGLYKIKVDNEGKVVLAEEYVPTISNSLVRHVEGNDTGDRVTMDFLETKAIRITKIRFSSNVDLFDVNVNGESLGYTPTWDIPANTEWQLYVSTTGDLKKFSADIIYNEL